MFRAYIENWSKTYEPAEGGYYVSVSNIHEWKEFESEEDCIQAIIDEAGEGVNMKVYRNVTHQALSDRPDTWDGYPDYDYIPVVLDVELPDDDQEIILIEDGVTAPAPTIYLGYR